MKKNANISQRDISSSRETINQQTISGGMPLYPGASGQPGIVLPLNAVSPLSVIRNVQVNVTRALDQMGVGTQAPIDYSGWDSFVGIPNPPTVTTEVLISSNQW